MEAVKSCEPDKAATSGRYRDWRVFDLNILRWKLIDKSNVGTLTSDGENFLSVVNA